MQKIVLRHINGRLYGNDYEERLFNVAMELCITWMNRILFFETVGGSDVEIPQWRCNL